MDSSEPNNIRARAEIEHLNRLEAIVRRGLDAEVEVGLALAEISHTRLYRYTHETFEAYLRDRWGVGWRTGYQLIQAAEQACSEFGGDDVTAVDITVTVHKLQLSIQPEATPSPESVHPAEVEADTPLPQLRWLMTQSSGTIADAVHQVEIRGDELDPDARAQLRADLSVVEEELEMLKLLLLVPADWNAEYERLLAGEIPPFEDDADDEEND